MPKRIRSQRSEFSPRQKHRLILDDFGSNPSCSHGPQICFERDSKRFYSCSAFRSPKECQQNSKEVQNKVSNSGLAQYIFSKESTEVLTSIIESAGIQSVLCLGVPSVHKNLLKKNIKCLLLDLDPDVISQFTGTSVHYNMCNHHFFNDDRLYKAFLKASQALTIILDPPFSAKPELLSFVHGLIEKDWKLLRAKKETSNVVGHIQKANSSLKMSDYQITYTNHLAFSEGAPKSRKRGSPIRFLTNFPLKQIKLPQPGYKFCDICEKYVANTNNHCFSCGDCTSKDGQTYRHCKKCQKCVKPTWFHCGKCKKCVLSAEHVC